MFTYTEPGNYATVFIGTSDVFVVNVHIRIIDVTSVSALNRYQHVLISAGGIEFDLHTFSSGSGPRMSTCGVTVTIRISTIDLTITIVIYPVSTVL